MNIFKMKDEANVKEDKLKLSVWKTLYDYCEHHHRSFKQLIAVMVGFSLADLMIPWLMKYGIDEFITPGTTDGLPFFISLIAIAVFFRSFLVFLMIRIGGRLNVEVAYEIRQDCFVHIQKLSLSYFDYRPVGWLMSRITSDCRTLGSALSWGLVDLIFGVAMVFLISVIMLVMSFKLAIIVLLIIPVLFIVSYLFKKYILNAFREVREYNAQVSGAFNEGVSGAGTTKLLVQEDRNFEAFQQVTDRMALASVNAATKSSIYLPLILLIGSIGTAVALWKGGTYVFEFQSSNGLVGISYGTLVAFIAYSIKFFQPIQDIARR
ncbi:MAG: ABC transporter ATP-binding protein, partial [Lentisphaeria bacterium]|nr:ABC transporter ATP-binding protein [Lentisphaeria bacterium]